jgi:choline dehydrogenase-like flavoprotein
MHPLSRGTVHIGSSDPLAPPLIDPNYFANEADLDLLVHTLTFTIKLMKTPPFADIVRSHVLPAADAIELDEGLAGRLREYVRQTVGPVFHPVGTAAMLPLDDGGVVDCNFKVYGTSNLRVVSTFP